MCGRKLIYPVVEMSLWLSLAFFQIQLHLQLRAAASSDDNDDNDPTGVEEEKSTWYRFIVRVCHSYDPFIAALSSSGPAICMTLSSQFCHRQDMPFV